MKYIYICSFTISIFHRMQVVLSSRMEWEKEREPLRVVPFNSKNFITICFPHDRWKSYAAFFGISKWRMLLVFVSQIISNLDLIKFLINFSKRWIIQHDKTYFNSYFLFFYFFFFFYFLTSKFWKTIMILNEIFQIEAILFKFLILIK